MREPEPSQEDRVIALDIGGMSIRSGVVGHDRSVRSVNRTAVDHRAGADELLAGIWSSIEAGRPRAGSRIAIAIPGPFDHDAGVSTMTHKFASLHGLDLRAALVGRSHLPGLDIRFVNDAAAAGAGEVLAAGVPEGLTLVLTLGTGLGASLFDGRDQVPTKGGIDVAELWATPLADGVLADTRFSATGLAAVLGVDTADLPSVTRTPSAAPMLAAWGTALGRFIESLRQPLGLRRVIIGGGAAGAFDRFGPAVAAEIAVSVSQARLGSSGPLLGAAALAFGIG